MQFFSGKSHLSCSKKVFIFFPGENEIAQLNHVQKSSERQSMAVSAHCCVCSVNTGQSPVQTPVWHGLTYRHSGAGYLDLPHNRMDETQTILSTHSCKLKLLKIESRGSHYGDLTDASFMQLASWPPETGLGIAMDLARLITVTIARRHSRAFQGRDANSVLHVRYNCRMCHLWWCTCSCTCGVAESVKALNQRQPF